jgi:hypothetical protein
LGEADTTTFRDAITKAMIEAAKRQSHDRATITPVHLGGRRQMSDTIETATVTDTFIKASDTVDAAKLAERGMLALERLLTHQRDGLKADPGLEENKFALAFNYAGILAKGALEQKQALNSQESALFQRDAAAEVAPKDREGVIETRPEQGGREQERAHFEEAIRLLAVPIKDLARESRARPAEPPPPAATSADVVKPEIRIVQQGVTSGARESEREPAQRMLVTIEGRQIDLLERLVREGRPEPPTAAVRDDKRVTRYDAVLDQLQAERHATTRVVMPTQPLAEAPTVSRTSAPPTPAPQGTMERLVELKGIEELTRTIRDLTIEKMQYSKENAGGYFDSKIAGIETRIQSLVQRRDEAQRRFEDGARAAPTPDKRETKTEIVVAPTPTPTQAEAPPATASPLTPQQIETGLKLLADLSKVAGDIFAYMQANTRNEGQVTQIIRTPQTGNPLESLHAALSARARGTNGTRRF